MPEDRDAFERAIAALRRPVYGDDLAVGRIMVAVRRERPPMRFRNPKFVAAAVAVIGLSISIWQLATPEPSAIPSDTERDVSYFQFVFFGPQAEAVSLVGSFNDWDPRATPLQRDANRGVWSTEVALRPGHHEYSFNVDGRWVPDDDAPLSASDEFGAANSVILVQ